MISDATITASAPGSLMLLGEHAVLHGKRALACAISRRVRVASGFRRDAKVIVTSDLGRTATDLSRIEIESPHRFVLASIARVKDRLSTGLDVTIESEFSERVGLGSSGAVTVATTAALEVLMGGSLDLAAVLDHGVSVVRAVQGIGSGADIAASTHGGIVAYRSEPRSVERLSAAFPMTVIYSGGKKPTVEVIEKVERTKLKHPEVFDQIFSLMDSTAPRAAAAIQQADWETLGMIFNINQGLMDALGVSNATLSDIVYALREDSNILGSKISGSGLGDCVIGLGHASPIAGPHQRLDIEMTDKGVTLE